MVFIKIAMSTLQLAKIDRQRKFRAAHQLINCQTADDRSRHINRPLTTLIENQTD